MIWETSKSVYLIAEIGGNHEGDFEYAMHLTDLACSSGADAVKFQIYTGDSLVNPVVDADRNKHFKKFELTPEQHIELAKKCSGYGVDYLASVWDPEAIEWIDPWLKFYKIGSGDLTAYQLLEKIAQKNKPIVLSAGLSTLEEVKETISFITRSNPYYRETGNLAVLQCTSMYPIPDECANLNVLKTFQDEFGIIVGYSDHTIGSLAVEVAVTMGAEILEVHFTDSREDKTFRDHKVSFTKNEIQLLLKKICKIKELQGSGLKAPTKSEIDNNHQISFRRGLYPRVNIEVGETLTEQNLVSLRPNRGIDAKFYKEILGKRVKNRMKKNDILSFENLE